MTEPANPNYATEVTRDFARQGIMQNLGAYLISVTPGQVEMGVDFRHDLTQQHGYLHAGVITTIVDSACGFAAYTLMPPGSGVLTVEYKVNFMAPARGEKFIAVGRVVKAGKTLSVCNGEVFAVQNGERKVIAVIQTTMMRMAEKAES
ncbi:MAG: PaaI family thioesterase [Acidobacteria bacterium]|nr:PaaI family thioesterase [Acidobacteriota bacterium]